MGSIPPMSIQLNSFILHQNILKGYSLKKTCTSMYVLMGAWTRKTKMKRKLLWMSMRSSEICNDHSLVIGLKNGLFNGHIALDLSRMYAILWYLKNKVRKLPK